MRNNSVTEWEEDLEALDTFLIAAGFKCVFDTINSSQAYAYRAYELNIDDLGKKCCVRTAVYDKKNLCFDDSHIISQIKTRLGNAAIGYRLFETVEEVKEYLLGE